MIPPECLRFSTGLHSAAPAGCFSSEVNISRLTPGTDCVATVYELASCLFGTYI